jgi:catechol 2,3-dioxygenase-like lactoylglutathione lyase family enzyme
MIETKGLAHFTIPVTDTRRSEKFYTEMLGMTPIQVNHERGMVFLDAGGDCVILARVDRPISTAGERDVHHAFIVEPDAYRSSVDFLKENGVDIEFEEDRQGGAVNGPRAYFRDLDGNVLEIIDLTSYKGDATGA